MGVSTPFSGWKGIWLLFTQPTWIQFKKIRKSQGNRLTKYGWLANRSHKEDMSSLKKEMGSLFPGKVQSLLNERCTKSGSQCTEDSNHEHPKPRAQEPLSGGGWGGGGSVNRWMLPPPKSKSKLEARADPFPPDTGSLLGPLLTRVPGTMEALPYIWWGNNPHPEEELQGEEHDRGDRESGKGALGCPVLPKERERGQLKGYSGNELTPTQESVRRGCLLCKKCLLSYLEMTSELPRPLWPTGRGRRARGARVLLSWQKGQQMVCRGPKDSTEDERMRRTPLPEEDQGHRR